MKRINLIFGCHAHQPVGNFDFVLEQAHRDSYRPFLEVLERFPEVRVTLHFTGPLYDWFEGNDPAFLEKLAQLVGRGQVEIMGGGYYEPLLCAIPGRDAVSQIVTMQRYCEKRFGSKPRGMWLTERVWEPHMASILARAGVEYTALDDAHFLCSGLRPADLFGYYLTEDEGKTVKVFPIQEKLRYLVPFHQVGETIDWLREQATEEGDRCAVLHDDYEKFGVWPGTNRSVYEEGWLETFFRALTDNRDWLRCITYSQYLDEAAARGRTYITCASYDEMMTWALPTAMQRDLVDARQRLRSHEELNRACAPFMRGGFWRSFLAKYAESNNIQKRMLRVSERLHRLMGEMPGESRLAAAEKLLHQGQCNCAYWHGVFGGLYLNHLRTALYEKLIEADAVLDGIENRPGNATVVESRDFDGDGNDEGILDNRQLTLFFSPADGGTLFEMDYKPKPFNFGNVLTRRDEVYHDQLRKGTATIGQEDTGDLSIHEMVKAKEAHLDRYLVYDPWRRVSLRDRFLKSTATAETLWSGIEPEMGTHATASYGMRPCENGWAFSGAGRVAGCEGEVCIEKTVILPPEAARFSVQYQVTFAEAFARDLFFGTEFAINLLTGNAHDRYYVSENVDLQQMRLGATGCLENISHIALRDEWQQVEVAFRFSSPARLFHFSVDTVSQSEGGQERVHQGCVVLPCWPLASLREKRFSVEISVEITRLGA